MSHKCSAKQAGVGVADCELLIISYIFAGLAMMLNIRLSYSSAPYALIRFKLPENLFSVFVRRIASALELWCLPSMLLGNIIDLIQKLAVNTDGDLKASAGTGPTDHEKLRGLAKTLHDKAEELNNAVTGGSEDAAKVLRHKAGTEAQKSDTKYLRKLAKELHEKATRLENQAPEGTDNPSLKQKAGSTPDDGLRQLAAELYKATKELSNTGADDQGKAGELATAVGDSETSEGIRAKLKNLATGTGDAEDVTGAYGTVESAFGQVQQQEQQGKYTTGDKQEKYQAVKRAWEAFKTLYTTNLKQLANGLKVTVGNESDSDKLQKTLADLGNHQGAEAPTTEAGKVKTAYSTSGTSVKQKFTDLQAKGPSYQAIAAIKPLYEAVESAMNAFDNVYRPEELLKDEVGDGANENKGLQQKLKELYTDGHDTEKLPGLAKAVRNAYSEGWGPTVKSRFESVMAQEKAYAQGNTIKTTEYKGLLEAWTNFNDKYYGVISYYKYYSIVVPSVITQWLNFLTYVILFVVYVAGGDSGHLTIFYLVIAISGFVFGINMTLVYSVDWNYIPIYIAGENCFPIITSFIHYITTIMFGNRRKWNSDFIVVCVDIVVAIIISFVAAVIWTAAYLSKPKYASSPETGASWYHHIFTHGFSGGYNPEVISPFLMIVVGMGLVYAIYPGIAPGMIVPFYLIDKIEMVLLIMTIFPPVIVATLRRSFAFGDPRSPMCQWKEKAGYPWNPSADLGNGSFWHAFDLLMIIKIVLAGIFIYSLHYRESNLARSIINQPKMSTFLSITFYMCHECLLALGFPGLVGANNGGDYVLIPQYIGALFMIFLAFYSEGYIIEYKSHDPAHWPTEGMWYLYGYYQLNLDFLL